MSVSPVNNTRGPGQVDMGSSAADLSGSFMTLLIAQMQNQDPTNPMDNNQLTSQLAQFNTASEVEKLNDSVAIVGGMLVQMQEMGATSWVGREVMIAGDAKVTWGSAAEPYADAGKELNFNLSGDAETVTVTLTNDNGESYSAELKDAKPGVNKFSLSDLENFKPSPPPAGSEYTVTYSASNAGGEAPTVTGLTLDKVESVSFDQGRAVLHLASKGTTAINDIFVIQ
ncbi:flagellar biosynthesis protein FlgD [Erwinia amylovora]|uniref:flagellar hook assembly protein FlgD n=1 Tax=Erwinia amylovora TaxID=552 RepID=UPI001D099B74|nr:flagellar hook capping FlgD N-terminal domain-containing protein [Erwinia amylovora]UDJ85861.1 flagellar biosynthesis protein FlgD [Erwinia amylovora]UDK90613.1 flagellar biosynthesis protein FlgD [Erwinia amylovora]UDK94007.1 flagellar biosynthesis protein FlgD [Erwinia amylovora]UER92924.1 flagellar biosynthesis protein FlgD [Erwinia amylovora]UOD74848.1 flagellar biosynthesis protein FlgD [Erwinia amylovora]